MKVYLVRHGQTDWNVEHKLQGKADIDLNNTGIAQAKEAKVNLEDKQIDLIICSPLIRAKHTAEIINEGRNMPIIYDQRIAERDFGELQGKRKEEIDYEGFWSYKKNFEYEEAENIRDFFARIYGFLDEITEKYKDKNVLLVNHGGVSIPVDCYFHSIPEDDNLTALVAGNAEVKEYEPK